MNAPQRATIITLLLLCIALLPRITTLGRGLTTDEASFWQDRSATFFAALAEGHFEDTMITGHPGVTTMWLGSIGLLVERSLHDAGLLPAADHQWQVTKMTVDLLHAVGIEHLPPFEYHLSLMRLPVACATALLIAIGYWLLLRLVGSTAAFIAALLWATDPFLVAFSRLLHVDALLSMLMLVATLALLAACYHHTDGPLERPRLPLLIVAGGATALAQLTKSSAALLLPIGALILVSWLWQRQSVLSRDAEHAPRSHALPTLVRWMVVAGITWGGAAIITACLAWPALWVAPREAIDMVVSEVIDNGGQPQKGSFLLGQGYIYETPGLLYYPVTLLGRTTPWTAAGLIACAFALFTSWPWLRGRRMPLLLVAGAAVLIIAALTVLPKKFDRYALPAMPLLHILAAVGLLRIGAWLSQWQRRVAALVTGAAAVATLLVYHPYYLAYYSPLIGGSYSAPDLVPIGWGEGLDVAADWLNQQPDIAQGAVASWSVVSLQPYLHTNTAWQGSADKGSVNYLIVYINQVQSGKDNHYFNHIHGVCTPQHTVQVKGIDYAWIYRMPLYRLHLSEARFEDMVGLDDTVMLPPNPCTCEPLTLTFVFEPLARPPQSTFFFLHIISPQGEVVLQRDLPLESLIAPEQWQSGQPVPYTIQLPLPPDTPAGHYHIVAGLYDAATGQRRTVVEYRTEDEWEGDISRYGADTLHVGTVELLDSVQQQCSPSPNSE